MTYAGLGSIEAPPPRFYAEMITLNLSTGKHCIRRLYDQPSRFPVINPLFTGNPIVLYLLDAI